MPLAAPSSFPTASRAKSRSSGPTEATGKSPIETLVEPGEVHRTKEEMVTRVFQLRNADLEPVRAVIAQLLSPGAELAPFPPDTLIVTEVDSNLERIEKLLARLDVAPADQLRVIPIKFASVQEVADKIQRILDKSRTPGGEISRRAIGRS